MSRCLIKSYYLLRYLADKQSNNKLVTIIIKNADDDLLRSFSELFHNILHNDTVSIKSKHKSKDFEKLASKTTSNSTKIRLLIKLRSVWIAPINEILDFLHSLCYGKENFIKTKTHNNNDE